MQARKATSTSVMPKGRAVPKNSHLGGTNKWARNLNGGIAALYKVQIHSQPSWLQIDEHLEFMQIESNMLGSYFSHASKRHACTTLVLRHQNTKDQQRTMGTCSKSRCFDRKRLRNQRPKHSATVPQVKGNFANFLVQCRRAGHVCLWLWNLWRKETKEYQDEHTGLLESINI